MPLKLSNVGFGSAIFHFQFSAPTKLIVDPFRFACSESGDCRDLPSHPPAILVG
jgi:hypothetical protein